MKFNKNTITLNLDEINEISLALNYANERLLEKGYDSWAERYDNIFEEFYNYLDVRGYYDDVKNN